MDACLERYKEIIEAKQNSKFKRENNSQTNKKFPDIKCLKKSRYKFKWKSFLKFSFLDGC